MSPAESPGDSGKKAAFRKKGWQPDPEELKRKREQRDNRVKRPPPTEEQAQLAKRLKRGSNGGQPLGFRVRSLNDKKLKGELKHTEAVVKDARRTAIKIGEWLLPSEGGMLEAEGIEKTYNFKQEDIIKHVEVGAAQKVFDLSLPDLGPYKVDFTRNGRYMLLGGRRGHLAMMDWSASQLVCEVQVAETTRDACFLHNELFFAAAQKKYAYIYDKRGIEIHCLKQHTQPAVLEFLPHHFLLASIGEQGVLRYQDTSHGQLMAQHVTRQGPCNVMRQNPYNAVLCLGHTRGVVTMWTPNMSTPVVKMLCHRGPVSALAVDQGGHHLVTAGVDNQVKVWDIRTLKPLHAYFSYSPAHTLDISQKGLLAVGYGRKIQIWQDALTHKRNAPYMSHTLLDGTIEGMGFCPFEDVLGLGHSGGVSTILVPGAGEPNFDSFVANPFQSQRERQEQEVHMLLDKLQPQTIMLDPEAIGTVRVEPEEVRKEKMERAKEVNRQRRQEAADKNEARTKMKGKNKPTRREKKKQTNIIEERRPEVQKKMQQEDKRRRDTEERIKEQRELLGAEAPRALARFYK